MLPDIQPKHLINDVVTLIPLQETDFDILFQIASNPLVWEQHPNPNRYLKQDFKNYFEGAIFSKGAFIIIDSQTNEIIGCTRFYDYNPENNSIKIGYTFLGINFWGGNYNKNIKSLMLNHAFERLENVHFDIGASNFRSQNAIGKIGATKIGQQIIEYYGDEPKLNFIYSISKNNFY